MCTPSTYTVVFNLEKHLHELPRNIVIKKITVEVKNCKTYIHIRIDYCAKAVNVLRILRGSVYMSHSNTWMAPLTLENLELLRDLELPESVFTDLMKFCPATSQDCTLNIDSGTTDADSSISDHTGISDSILESENFTTHRSDQADAGTIPADSHHRDMQVSLEGHFFCIYVPYCSRTIKELKKIRGIRWSPLDRKWKVPVALQSFKALQDAFNCWEDERLEEMKVRVASIAPEKEKLTLYSSPEYKDSFILKIEGKNADFHFIKSLPFRHYEIQFKRWIIPADEYLIKRIIEHFSLRGANINARLPKKRHKKIPDKHIQSSKRAYLISHYARVFQDEMTAYIDTMIQIRYSYNTIRNYCGELLAFFKYLDGVDPKSIGEAQVNQYLTAMARTPISDSKLNAAINAVKFYYSHVCFVPSFQIERIRRPKRSSKLPEVLSLSEIDRLLSAVDNVKHAAMLYTLYSAGLRLSELLGLHLKDLIWDRNQMFIRASKGKKDRYVMLSPTLKELLKYYFEQYRPVDFLFEGQKENAPYTERI